GRAHLPLYPRYRIRGGQSGVRARLRGRREARVFPAHGARVRRDPWQAPARHRTVRRNGNAAGRNPPIAPGIGGRTLKRTKTPPEAASFFETASGGIWRNPSVTAAP